MYKEILVSMMNGLIWSLVVAVIATAWFQDAQIGLIIAAALVINLLCAALAGLGIPLALKQIGIDADGSLIVRTSHDYYQPDADFIRWTRQDKNSSWSGVRWATPSLLEPRLKTSLQHHFRGEVLPVERVILDLHSGRFFGWLGPWLFDAAAVLLILLSLSGSWIWLKHRR